MRWATFADSLWYIDALASAAKLGFEAFCRQDYIGADYGLVDCSTGAPLPDFWSVLLWTQLTTSSVLSATAAPIQMGVRSAGTGVAVSEGSDNEDTRSILRLYAHCTPQTALSMVPAWGDNSERGKGQTTLVAINLSAKQVEIELDSQGDAGANNTATLWQLAPSNQPGIDPATGLNGTGLTINGRPLHLLSDGGVPNLQMFGQAVAAVGSGERVVVKLAPQSISFVVYNSSSHGCS